MKRFLFLGAAWGQISPINYFRNNKNFEIFTLDNKKNNPGHKMAKESFNISIDDVQSIKKVVSDIGIDAIFCFASDAGLISQSIISRELGMHFNTLESIKTLTNKFNFREFLFNENIQRHFFMKFSIEDLNDKNIYDQLIANIPLVVKPMNGSGSKGVNFIFHPRHFNLIKNSLQFSSSKTLIIEKFFYKNGMQICGDGFFEDSKLKNFSTGDGHFYEDSHYMVPYAESFPSSHSKKIISSAKVLVEKILNKIKFSKGPINFDIIVVNGKPFVIEIAPRSGGNYIPDVIKKHNGVDLLRATLNTYSDPGYSFNERKGNINYVSSYMIHSLVEGRFDSLEIKEDLLPYIYDKILYVKKGDIVKEFTQGSYAIGNIKLKFPDFETQRKMMDIINDSINVIVS